MRVNRNKRSDSAQPSKAEGVGELAPKPNRKPRAKKDSVKSAAVNEAPIKSLPPRGNAIIESLEDPHRRRGAYVMLQRAISLALDVPFDAMKVACMTAVKDLANPDDRIRSRAREFLLKVQESGVGASVDLDRVQRLDDGTATENIAVASITPEALAAVVKTIRLTIE